MFSKKSKILPAATLIFLFGFFRRSTPNIPTFEYSAAGVHKLHDWNIPLFDQKIGKVGKHLGMAGIRHMFELWSCLVVEDGCISKKSTVGL